jgi:hypothetical protein
VTINNLLEDVLLEIFDAYRKDIELLPRYEKIWNSSDGWFKLTHVCQRWRRLVHLSPTRLHVHLLLTPRRSSRVLMLKNLPPFPVLVDYHFISSTETEDNLALAALRHRSRVRGIVLRRSYYRDMAKLLRSLSHPYPELESLEICPSYPQDHGLLMLPATFLSGSAPRLRQLTLGNVAPASLSPFLSLATGLVKLTLSSHTHYSLLPEATLLSILQRMSCLCHLELNLIHSFHTIISDPPPPAGTVTGDVVPLSKLTHIIFRGHRSYLQALMVGLAAPSLRFLDADLSGSSRDFFPIPHLCKFIRDTECRFTAIRLKFSRWTLKFYAGTDWNFAAFRIIIPKPVSLERIGQELSGPLSTVEELIITFDEGEPPIPIADQLHELFYHVPQVKMVMVPDKVALDVARSFQQDDRGPAMDLLPALEQVKVEATPITPSESDRHTSIRDAFELLIAARKQLGCPIMLSLL